MKLRRRITTWVAALLALALGLGGLGLTQAFAAAGDVPAHDKTLTVNDDGTYTLALNVKGDSEKQIQKVNVIVIVDRSGSMSTQSGTGAYVPTTGTGNGLYGLIEGQYVPLERRGTPGNRTFWYNDVQYTGQRYQYDATATRMQATQAAVNSLAETLLDYNGKDGNPNDTVQLALVSFATTAQTNVQPTTSYSTFSTAVNGLNANGGTNWEASLQQANGVNFGDTDQTFAIFFSDGSPTFHSNDGGYNNWNQQYGVYGSGQEQEPNMEYSYTMAVDDAATLATKVTPNNFYTIFAYGTTVGAGYMTNLTTAAGAPAGNNYSASNTAELNDAFAEILESIEMAGIGAVAMEDGTTSSVTTTTGEISHLLDVDPNSFKYYRAGGANSDGTEKYDSTANGGLGEEWADAPAAEFVNGAVDWDLSSEGVLENDVTYTVTFDCWPSQTTLDIVADLKNDPSSYDELDANIQKYIERNGDLKTNTTATLSYTDTRTGESNSEEYENPDPVQTTAVEELALSKEWENELDGQSAEPITLTVTRDGTDHHTVTLSDETGWTASTFISIGIMRTHGEEPVELLTTGHDFTFTEPEDLGYYWELEVPTVRPMIVDGQLKILVKVDEAHPAPEGATVYTLPVSTGVAGGDYYVDDNIGVGLTATNHRRARLNLTKVVDGPDANPEQAFPFTLNVVDSKASEGSADNLDSDYYVWFSIYNGGYVDGVVSGADKEIGEDGQWTGYYYAPSGTDIAVNLKAGDNLRFLNLPTGTTYTLTEGTLPDNYKFVSSELSGGTDSTFSGAQTTTGTIEDTNTDYTVTYTNQYALSDVEITKVWEDNGDQDGMRPTVDEFVEYLVLKADGTDVTAASADKLTVTVDPEDSNKYIAKWAGLDRFAEGEEIVYTVEETEIDGYTTTGSPAEDKGTITNTHEPEVIDIPVEKVWEGPAGDAVTVTLYANGEATESTVTLSADNQWKGTFTGLPKCADGEEIEYSVVEDGVSGVDATKYDITIEGSATDGFTITNTNTETVEATVKKVWDDAEDQDGKRPDTLTVTLSDGQTVTLNEENGWTATVENLPKFTTSGEEIEYTWSEDEDSLPEGYTLTGTAAEGTVTTLTNSYTPKETEATVKKVWDDADNQDGIRPSELKVTLSNGTEVTLNADNEWTATVNNLPMYKDGGQPITYTWEEASLPEGYELTNTSIEGTVTTLTNSHKPEETEATVKKVWSDADNQDGIRPASLEVTLSNGTKVTLSDTNEWTATVSKLPKYAAGTEINYTWTEASVEGYELTSTDKQGTVTTLTNSHTPEETEATVKKVWDDADNQDGYRPDSITVTLSDGQTVTLSDENDWTATITGLPKYAEGDEIKYTWTEADIEHYTLSDSTADGTVTTLTNSHTPEVVNVSVEKVWEDAENQDGIRPDSVQVQLKANDVATGDPVTLDASNEWAYTWENLDKKAAGEDIAYTVEEVEVPEGYGDETTGTQAEGYLVTNVHTPETTEINVTKVWDDADDQDGYRPASVTVNLYADGEATGKSVALNEGNNWTNTFTDLFVYKPGEVGQAITYSIDENEVDQYTVAIDGDAATGFTVTNSHTPEKTEVPVTKVWDDADNQDGIRPATITVALLANGADTGKTVTLSADNEWSDTFTDLDKKAAGKDIAYTVAEVSVDGYASETTGTAAEGYVITNRHTPEVTDVPVTKVWDDADDQDGIRLANVVVKLLADGADTGKTVTLNEANGWKATFTGVDKYAAGAEIAYTVAEDAPAGYQVAITGDAAAGYTVTNSHTPELTEVKVTKVWSDADDQDGIRPADVTVKLLADGADTGKTVTLSADNDWAGTFTGLDKYAAGELVKYTVEEDPVADYAVAVAGDAAEGFTVTNSHTPGTTAVNVKKVWDDGNDHDGIRPASVTVELLADGKATGKTVTLDESNGWAGSFADLQKNAAGKAIKYTVEEKAVEGYTAKVSGSAADGFTVTNYHKVAEAVMIDPPVQKVIKVPVGTKPAAATFTFQMKAVTEGAPMPEGSVNGVKTMTIEGAGSKEFGEAWIDMPGTYVYEITEVKGDAKGYAYDTTAYTLTVEVTKNADGDLVKTETITTADGKAAEKVVFTNTFTPEPPVLPQTSDDSVPTSTIVVTALTGVALVAAGSALRLRKEN